MQTERVKEGMQMRTWDADKTFKTLQEYNHEFQNVERPSVHTRWHVLTFGVIVSICLNKKTYKYSYVYIYIDYTYILYIYNHTNNVQPKLSNWHTSHLWFIYPNELDWNLDKLLRPTSEHDSPTSTEKVLGIPLVAGHLWKQNLPKGKTPISVAKAHLNGTQIIQCWF